MPPRLLYIVNDAAFFVSHRLPLGIRGRQLGLDVAIAAPDGPGRLAIERAGLRFLPVPMERSGAAPWREAATVRALERLLRHERPSLLHNVTVKPVIYGGISARIVGVPAVVSSISGMGYVFTAKGATARARRFAVRSLYRAALGGPGSRVIFQNETDRAEFVERGLVRPARASVIGGGSGVDVDAYSAQPAGGPPMVVLPARMLRDKGVEEFARAAKVLRTSHPSARFVLAGGIDRGNPSCLHEGELRRLAAETGVEWRGHCGDMPSLLCEAHIVCLPSYREGTPRALLEAAAAGRAVVTTDVPGCRDAIVPNVTGLLVPARDSRALAGALSELLADPSRAAAMGRAGRRHAEAHFRVDAVVDAIFDVYRMVAPPELVVALPQRIA